MYEINGTTISMTKGDSVWLVLSLTYKDTNDDYEPVEGDSIRFALKKKYKDETPLILDIPVNTLELKIEPEHTKNLDVGSYKYDIELTRYDGFVDTFISRADFKILEEVY